MRYISINAPGARLKKFTAAATSGNRGKSVVRIEIEVTGHWELADMIHQLQTIEAEQLAELPSRPAARRGAGK